MSQDRRKMNKQSTGTIPKIKHRNNTSYRNEREGPVPSWTNNLALDLQRLNLTTDHLRNTRRNLPNYRAMNTAIEEQNCQTTRMNGSVTPITSSSNSRRNSSGTVPKCDNITKYPDKKQIEDKLSQIREYLQITTSLMSSMKNTGEQSESEERENLTQMVKDLKDSEAKLIGILESMEELGINSSEQIAENDLDNYSESGVSSSHRNGLEDKEQPNREVEALRDHQLSLLSLQQKAENKLKDARQMQDKLLSGHYGNELNSISNQRDKNFASIDAAIKELEERTTRLKEPRTSTSNLQDKLLAEVDSLHNQIVTLHNVNEDRNQLIQVLDNRDAELRAQHHELQTKLNELQTKKLQVDQLVVQLQNLDEADEEDVGGQVRKIVTMKDQLSKLKDMLEIVKSTENVIQNTVGSQEEQDLACAICTKAENFLQKDKDRVKTQVQVPESNNVRRYENESRIKQVNKNGPSGDRQNYGGAKPRTNKLALQVELEAKKRELEEIMGKHKAGTSNLNHDTGIDNKSEFSCSSNTFYEGAQSWTPLTCEQNRFDSSESDDCPDDVNSDGPSQEQTYTLPLLNNPRPKITKHRPDCNSDYIQVQEVDRSSLARTPERILSSIPSNKVNVDQLTKSQAKKQLELIKSVCDSMLEQEQQSQNNVQQLRNNLTPSPLYSEPRRFASPNPHSMNALNVVNPLMDPSWNPNAANFNNQGDYQSWLAANSLQTQTFMLNTLNQCCQMLWLQQRELMALRQTVGQLQDRLENPQFESHLASPGDARPVANQYRSNQKMNQVSGACSMPNLNQYNIPSNMDPNYNNMQSARLLDPCLNNVNMNLNSDPINNSVMHGVNANINQVMPGQIWNGQALNNQVAPGNRANNYWDNFRSYSRQNLLSTKSNEGLQCSTMDRTNPFALIQPSKSNSGQTSANVSQENTPNRRIQSISLRHTENRTNSAVPPDVLNVNHNINKPNEFDELNQRNSNIDLYFNNAFPFHETSSNNSISEDQIFKECISEQTRRRNEWHEEQNEETHQKSKLFEELRENVYKEVVTLISANETRPHFLIQLFRDLQMISSDPLRLKILQSIQTIITHSLISSSHVNRQIPESQPTTSEQIIPDCFSVGSSTWSKSPKSSAVRNLHSEIDNSELQSSLKEIIPYLSEHEEEIVNPHFLLTLKEILIESETFQQTHRDTMLKKHFSSILDEALAQFRGKKVHDVKMSLVQTIGDLLRGDLSFIHLIQDTCSESCDSTEVLVSTSFEPSSSVCVQVDSTGTQVQNGDLAEADQDRVEDDSEEEGAVGGFWDQLEPPVVLPPNPTQDEVDLGSIEFQNNTESQTQFMKQGLDQVPTRLPTKSRSNTPNRSASRSD